MRQPPFCNKGRVRRGPPVFQWLHFKDSGSEFCMNSFVFPTLSRLIVALLFHSGSLRCFIFQSGEKSPRSVSTGSHGACRRECRRSVPPECLGKSGVASTSLFLQPENDSGMNPTFPAARAQAQAQATVMRIRGVVLRSHFRLARRVSQPIVARPS